MPVHGSESGGHKIVVDLAILIEGKERAVSSADFDRFAVVHFHEDIGYPQLCARVLRHGICALGKAIHKPLRYALESDISEEVEAHSQIHAALLPGRRANIIQPELGKQGSCAWFFPTNGRTRTGCPVRDGWGYEGLRLP